MKKLAAGIDVYEAGLERMLSAYEGGHTVVITMSGGKDSAVCLELAIEAARITGRLPVNVVTRDEEIGFPGVFEYLERVAARPEVDFKWVIQHQPVINVFNRAAPYFWCFDPLLPPERWVRRYPEKYAVISDEMNIRAIVHPRWFPVPEGKNLVSVMGLRVSESVKRRLGLASSGGHYTKVVKYAGVPFRTLRPIYDWTDSDVWRSLDEFKWDYAEAYDVMHRLGIPPRALRLGPPTMTHDGATLLRVAAKAWPRWFDRVCDRLEGVRQAAQFGALVCKPRRRVGETWEGCFQRTCIDDAPAEWIRERAARLRDDLIACHAAHSSLPIPEIQACITCKGAGLSAWRKMTQVCFNGDPFSTNLWFPYMEPEFFREGAGTWGGEPSF